jgi:hypothetical protein
MTFSPLSDWSSIQTRQKDMKRKFLFVRIIPEKRKKKEGNETSGAI